ncbi:MAG: hypothetical protein K2P13_11435 [Lachnospiraceae bacterium]|nr:hypothetical protein [Lachnospiraceae bacterium]
MSFFISSEYKRMMYVDNISFNVIQGWTADFPTPHHAKCAKKYRDFELRIFYRSH